jgi:protein gp37
MADHTHIEWTDATWNPITGCSVVSPGCTNCYAMRLAGTRLKHHPSRAGLTIDTKGGPVWNGEVRFNMDWIEQPLSWTKPRRIFVCAHGDLFHPAVPDDWIAWVYGVAIAAVHLRGHTFQVLTKRTDRAHDLLNSEAFWDQANAYASDYVMNRVDPLARRRDDARATLDDYGPDRPPPGIWLGASVEDQARADERIPALLDTPAAVRWISAEPLLGPVDLRSIKAPREPDEPADNLNIDWRFDALEIGDYYWFDGQNGQPGDCSDGPYRDGRIDWVVAGGESGQGARPMHPEWARDLRDQCARATLHGDDAPVPFLFKQWGEWTPGENVGRRTGRVEVADWIDDRWMFSGESLAATDGHVDDEPDLYRVGKKAAGRTLDGQVHDAFPEVP